MSVSIAIIFIGAVLLIIGLIGGGIKFGVEKGNIYIPPLPLNARILAFIIGIGFIVFGLWRDTYSLVTSQPAATPIWQTTPSSPSQESATAESTNWAFTLEYRFPAGFWSTGTHQYSFEWSCPNETPDSTTRNFMVSDNYPMTTGDVYLRWSSLKIGSPFGDAVEGINPAQPTVASIAWDAITKSEADSRALNCTGTISWDGGAKEPLTPQIPFQH